MAGQRPDLVITAKKRGGDKDTKRVRVGAAWKSDRGEGYSVMLDEGVTITVSNEFGTATIVRKGEFFLDIYPNNPPAQVSALPTLAEREADPF